MELTVFTLLLSILWVSVFVKVISLLRNQMALLKTFSIYPLLIMLFLCLLRILLPIELPYTIPIKSKKILTSVFRILYAPCIHIAGTNVTMLQILAAVWIFGAIIILVRYVHHYHKICHLIHLLPAVSDPHLYDILTQANLGQKSNITIKQAGDFTGPAIIGFLHPVILIPNMEFSDSQWYGFFIHELSHYKFGHQFLKLLATFLQAVFWWNPAFRILSSEVCHALEMHSDKAVCSRLTKEQQVAYLSGLLSVLENQTAHNQIMPYSCNLVETKDEKKLRQRFCMILENSYQCKKPLYLAAIPLIAMVFLLSYSVVFQPYGEPTAEDYGGSMPTPLEGDLYYFLKSEHGYDLYDMNDQFIFSIEDPFSDNFFQEIKIYQHRDEVIK